jgi:hypothetical protein
MESLLDHVDHISLVLTLEVYQLGDRFVKRLLELGMNFQTLGQNVLKVSDSKDSLSEQSSQVDFDSSRVEIVIGNQLNFWVIELDVFFL